MDYGYFNDLCGGDGITEKEVTYGANKKICYFRKITAGEQLKLSRGQRVTVGNKEENNKSELDIGDLTTRQHMLVQFSVVTKEGAQVFKKIEQVQNLPNQVVASLYSICEEVNKDEVTVGND